MDETSRRGRRAVVVAAIVTGAVLGLVLLLLVGARLYLAEERVRAIAQREADEAVAGRLSIGELSWVRFPTEAEIRDLAVEDLQGREVLFIERARVTLAPGGLLRRRVHITEARAEGAVIRLLRAEPDGFTITEAFASADPGEPAEDPWDVVVDRADVVDGRLELELEPGRLLVEGLSIEGASIRWENGVLTVEIEATADEATLLLDELELVARDVRVARATIDQPGEPRSLTARVEGVTASELEAFGAIARLTDARLVYREDSIEVERLALELEPGSVIAALSVDLTGPAPVIDATATLTGIDPGALAARLVDPGLMPRSSSGEIRVWGLTTRPLLGDFAASLDVVGLPPALIEALPEDVARQLPAEASIEATGSMTVEGVEIERLAIGAGPLSVVAGGEVRLTPEVSLNLDYSLAHEDPTPLLDAAGAPFAAQRVSLSGTVVGDVPLPEVEGELIVTGLSGGPLEAMTLTAPLLLTRGTLRASGARLVGEPIDLELNGSVGLLDEGGSLLEEPPIDASVTVSRVDLAAMGAPLEDVLEGTLAGTVTLSGTLNRPLADARLRADRIVAMGLPLEDVRARVLAGAEEARLMDARAFVGDEGRLDASGLLRLETGAVDARLRGERLPLARLALLLDDPPPLEGWLDVVAGFSGTLDELGLEATMRAEELAVAGVSVGRARARMEGDAEELGIEAVLEGPAGSLRAEGRLLPARRRVEDLRVLGEDISLEELPFIARLPMALTGVLAIDAEASGDLPFPRVRGRVEIEDLAAGGRLIHRGRLVTRVGPLDEGDYAIGVTLPGAAFVRVRLSPGPPLSIEAMAEIQRLELGWVSSALVEAEIGAEVTGEATVRFRRDPSAIDALAQLSEVAVTVAGETLSSTRPLTLRWDGETMIIEDLVLEGPPGRFEAGGALGPVMDFFAFGRLDAAIIGALVPQVVRAEGALAIDLRATGTRDDPRILGRVDLVDRVRLLPRGMLRDVVVDAFSVTLMDDRVELQILEGGMVGGRFSAGGFAELVGWRPDTFDVNVTATAIPFRAADLFAEVNADLRLTGEEGRGLLTGRVDVVRARYRREFVLSAFSLVADEPAVPPADPSPLLDILALDLRVVSLGAVDATVDAGAFGVEMVLDADLRVTGTAAAPALEGRVAAARGHVRTPQADLPIARGVIDFAPLPGEPLRALVDLVAEGEVIVPIISRDVLRPAHFVRVILEGELDEMVLDLSSQPYLDRLEILALLVTGQVAPEGLVPGDRRHVESAMVFAGTRLAEPLTELVTTRLEEVLNLDVLVAQVTAEGIAITAGAEVSRRLRLEGAVQQGFGDAGAIALVRAQVLLSNTVFLEAATASTTGDGGALVPREQDGRRSTLEVRARVLGR